MQEVHVYVVQRQRHGQAHKDACNGKGKLHAVAVVHGQRVENVARQASAQHVGDGQQHAADEEAALAHAAAVLRLGVRRRAQRR